MRFSETMRGFLRFSSGTGRASSKADWSRRDFIAVSSVLAAAATRLGAQPRKAKGRGPIPPERQRYLIHPAVGVARIGNSPDSFYLAPETIGGLPIECDRNGNPTFENGRPVYVKSFKENGRIRRQAAQFGVYVHDSADPSDPGREITLDDPAVESIEWTAHLANKKAAWYDNDELIGDVMLATATNTNYYDPNTSDNQTLHNPNIVDRHARQRRLIIDPGPRSISRPGDTVPIARHNIPSDYPHGSFPAPLEDGIRRSPHNIDTLGDLKMDTKGRLLVLGGFGRAGGTEPIVTYTGQDTWFDDISDGPVYCTLKLKGRAEPLRLTAWALIGSPKYAPELRNIVTLDDVMFDVAVRYQNLVPDMYSGGTFRKTYRANYERDIQPIFDRIADYIWVANVPSMVAFTAPKFNPRDASQGNWQNRQTFFEYFRDSSGNEVSPPHNELMHKHVPLVPLNSGSNSVTNDNIDRFMGLTNTQYFLLGQWAAGMFTSGPAEPYPVNPRDAADVGNCIGHPMSPGIEVTWTLRNPVVYESPYRIKHAHDGAYYKENGLNPEGDETSSWYAREKLPSPSNIVLQDGCEPGDLTKRMSPPWMSDFYQCAIEYVNFRLPATINETSISGIPPAPTYYSNWWPPQAPVTVITGEMTKENQMLAGLPAGYAVYFARGANNIANLVIAWSYMGFILNENDSPEGRDYPYFTEKERNHDRFVAATVSVASPVNQLAASGSYATPTNFFVPAWYLKEEAEIAECNGIPDCDKKP
jgi:L-lysine 6-oxidase